MQIFIKAVGGCIAQLAFTRNILHNNCWPYLHPPPELRNHFVDNGVWSNHAWKRSLCFCAGVMACVRTFNPQSMFQCRLQPSLRCPAVSLDPLQHLFLEVSTVKSIYSPLFAAALARTQSQSCAWMQALVPSSLAGSGDNPLGISTEWVVSVWPFRVVTQMPRITFWYFSLSLNPSL